jgi:putative transposase
LHDILTERAQASLQEIADELLQRGLRVCEATIRRALRAQGIVWLKPTRRVYATAAKGAKRYGYTAAHRREDVPPYSTNLTDAEWQLVADLSGRATANYVRTTANSLRSFLRRCEVF